MGLDKLLAVLPASAQVLGNQSLNGKFYFRQVSLGTNDTFCVPITPWSMRRNPRHRAKRCQPSKQYDYAGVADLFPCSRPTRKSPVQRSCARFPGLYQINVTPPATLSVKGVLPLSIQTPKAFHDQVDTQIQ